MHTSAATPAIPPLSHTWRRMLLAAGGEAPGLRRSMLCSIAAAAVQGLALACFYPLFSALMHNPSQPEKAGLWLAVLGALTLADGALRWTARNFDYSDSLATVTHDLRVRLGEQLRRMPLESLYRKRTGELSAVLAGNVDEVVTPMGFLSSVFLCTIVTPVVAALATLCVDWRLGLTLLIIFPLAMPLYRWRRRINGASMRDMDAIHARVQAELLEYAQGLSVLRAVNQVGGRAGRLQQALITLRDTQKKDALASVWPMLGISAFIELSLMGCLGLGVWFVLGGSTNLAALAALLVVAVRFGEPLTMLFSISAAFDLMESGFEQVENLLSVPPLPVPTPARTPQSFDIRFDNVGFHYADTSEPVLRDVAFSLPERSLTALVGPSGSGKTTITRLIMRYADPQCGTVRIGGEDLRDMEPETIMRHVSVVFQDVYLFDDTILNNIRMGRADATDAEVEDAARAAHCHEFISRLPDGYQTRVGDIGGCLSGGERQRISIARAILKNAPIVILDEPTAALDTESEVAVQRAIDTLVRDRTVIVIAHRLSTIVGADAILVFDEGRLVEQGRHAELMAKEGRYRAMWNAQNRAKDWHLTAQIS